MALFDVKLLELQEAIKDQNFYNQTLIISQITALIEQSINRTTVIQDILKTNFSVTLNDVIGTQLTVLGPAMKLTLHLMDDYDFRSYQFLPILKNIIRSIIFLVRTDQVEKSQLMFFDVIAILDDLLKAFLAHGTAPNQNEDLQEVFGCLASLAELVLSHEEIDGAVKELIGEIYIHILTINRILKCIFDKFMIIMKLANLGEEFLNNYVREFKKNRSELWLFKILKILLGIYEALIPNDARNNSIGAKIFESIFIKYITFVLNKLQPQHSQECNPQLFTLSIAILNTVLWTPAFSQYFYFSLLKKFIKLNGDQFVLFLSKSSTKIRKFTRYTMKIFLTAMIVHSGNSSFDKHQVLYILLHTRLFESLYELTYSQVVRNWKSLILLYDCSFLRQRLKDPLNAARVLENLTIIFNHTHSELEHHEMWSVLSIYAYCVKYAALSTLEYAGVQKTSEKLLQEVFTPSQLMHYSIDRNVMGFVKEFSININLFNTLTCVYLSQQPSLTSPKVDNIIPTYSLLPLLVSSDPNQVENVVSILKRKLLTEQDMEFVVEQCFCNLKAEEVVIGAALCLINTNLGSISPRSFIQIYSGTIAYLNMKQTMNKFSIQCYLCIVGTCAEVILFHTKVKTDFQSLSANSNDKSSLKE